MEKAVRRRAVVGPGGVIEVRLPEATVGASAEVIVLLREEGEKGEGGGEERCGRVMTGADILESGLVGIWEDRQDLGDSVEFARRLRAEAEDRGAGDGHGNG